MKKVLFGMAMVGTVGYYAAKKIVKKLEEHKTSLEEEIEELKNEMTKEEIEEIEKEMNEDKVDIEPEEHKIRKVVTAVVVAPFVVTAIPCIMAIEGIKKKAVDIRKRNKVANIMMKEVYERGEK